MKRVPEEKVVPSKVEQLDELRDRLTGNRAFARLRGRMGQPVMDIVSGLVDSSASPTAFCDAWDHDAGDIRVLGNLIAQLTRDGWTEAAAAFRSMLMDPAYILPGETIPIHETVPVTVLIVDFPRTLAMIKWIRAGHWMDLDAFLNGRAVNDLVRDLFVQFPSLRGYTTKRRQNGDYEGPDLTAAYGVDVLACVRPVLDKFPQHASRLMIAWQTYNDHLELHGYSFGFLFQEEQDAVLARFPRVQQQLVSTWFCRVPKVVFAESRRLFFGFHPAARHGEWIHEVNVFPSVGCSHNHGMVLLRLDDEAMQRYLHRYDTEMYGDGSRDIKEGEGFAFALSTRD